MGNLILRDFSNFPSVASPENDKTIFKTGKSDGSSHSLSYIINYPLIK